MSEKYTYSVKIDHDFGFFYDPKHYAPLLHVNDESAVLTKLPLKLENFLVVYIDNVRDVETSNKWIDFTIHPYSGRSLGFSCQH